MKTIFHTLLATSSALALLAAALTFAGCEAKSPDEMTVTVTPNYAKIKSGQSIALEASGWVSYNWSLENSEYGYLSSTVGSRVTYRAITGGGTQDNALPADTLTDRNLGGKTNEYTRTEHKKIDESTYNVKTYVFTTVTGSADGAVIKGSKTTHVRNEDKKFASTKGGLKQIVRVHASGSKGGTNSVSIAHGEVIILQEE